MAALRDHARADAGRAQLAFRDINDRVADLSHHWDGPPSGFICECKNLDCADTITLSLEEYEQIRADRSCFVLRDGYEDVSSDLVLRRVNGYVVVRERDTDAAQTPPSTRGIDERD